MNAQVPEEELLGIVEMLTFVADLCDAQPEQLNVALCRFAHTYYPAAELAGWARTTADRLARTIGFANANFEFMP